MILRCAVTCPWFNASSWLNVIGPNCPWGKRYLFFRSLSAAFSVPWVAAPSMPQVLPLGFVNLSSVSRFGQGVGVGVGRAKDGSSGAPDRECAPPTRTAVKQRSIAKRDVFVNMKNLLTLKGSQTLN